MPTTVNQEDFVAQQPKTSLDSALFWLALGFHPIPIEQNAKKKPAELGWQSSKFTEAELPDHFPPNMNVGILLGDERGSADVDMDCFEAIAAGRRLLPDTGIRFGRDSKPASHAIYLLNPPTHTKQFYKDPFSKAMIVELRCHAKNGRCMQTVVPCSIHTKSNETLRFEPGCNGLPVQLTADALEAAVAMVAAASLLGRYYPKFERNTTELAIAGILARKGWDVETAVHFVNAVYACAPANEAGTSGGDIPSPTAENSVRSTFANFAAGQEVTGQPKLRECYGEHVKAVNTAIKWLGIVVEEDKKPTAIVLDPGQSYKEHLIMTGGKDSHPKTDLANVSMTLRYDESWRGALGFDEFTSMVMVKRDGLPHRRLKPGPVLEEHFGYIQEWFQMAGHHGVSLQTIMQACYMVAKESPSHAVREYLEDLDPWTPETDERRLDTWLHVYLGAEDTPANRLIGRWWLTSMVARILNPGCQADSMAILEGEQGTRKSTAMRALMHNPDWFTDRLPDLGSKDADLQIQGKWLIEWAELDSLTRAETNRAKAFVSQPVNRFRPPYGRVAQDFKRQCIFVGTTNKDDYLKDETGARRYWPVRCGHIDIDSLRRDRDLLFAEALYLYGDGTRDEKGGAYTYYGKDDARNHVGGTNQRWYSDTKQEKDLLEALTNERYAETSLAEKVMAWCDDPKPPDGTTANVLSTKDIVLVREILAYCLEASHSTVSNQKQAEAEVTAVLKHRKWGKAQKRYSGGNPQRVWTRPGTKVPS